MIFFFSFFCSLSVFSAYYALPQSIIIVREKCYLVQCHYQSSPEAPVVYDEKKANRSGVTRARLQHYSEKEYEAMATGSSLTEAHGLATLRSKNFEMFQISYSRHDSHRFSKKRRVYSTGISTPHGFYLNQILDDADEGRIKRLKLFEDNLA